MVSTKKLRGIIAERGLSQVRVASEIGMSAKTFYLKMKQGRFGTDEAERLIDLLHIENPQEIFFAHE